MRPMITKPNPMTAEDLWRMPSDGQRHELVRGELTTMAPTGADHGYVSNNFSFLLTSHVKAQKLGEVFAAETGFRLAKSPDTVRGADVAFVRADRIPPGGRPKGFFDGAPDLAVETISPSDTLQEVEDKVDEYLQAGALLVLVLNPRRKTITVHQRNAPPILLHESDNFDAGNVVPGFRCRV